jgi:hypothetical protein
VTAQDWSSSTLDGPPFREVSSASVLGSTSAIVLPSSTIIDLEQHSSGPVLMTETVVGQHDFTTTIGKDVMVFTSPPPGSRVFNFRFFSISQNTKRYESLACFAKISLVSRNKNMRNFVSFRFALQKFRFISQKFSFVSRTFCFVGT